MKLYLVNELLYKNEVIWNKFLFFILQVLSCIFPSLNRFQKNAIFSSLVSFCQSIIRRILTCINDSHVKIAEDGILPKTVQRRGKGARIHRRPRRIIRILQKQSQVQIYFKSATDSTIILLKYYVKIKYIMRNFGRLKTENNGSRILLKLKKKLFFFIWNESQKIC